MKKIKNKKCIYRLSYRIMAAKKRKNFVGLAAIILTAVMFTSLFTISSSMIESFQNTTMREVGGSSMAGLKYLLPEEYALFAKDSEVKNPSYRIIIGSAKTDKEDKLNGLSLGADDYIEKPYDIDIMLAKIKGIFKRRYSIDEIADGSLKLNKAERIAFKDGMQIELTAKEYELLLLLVENKGRTLSKEYIFNSVWGNSCFSEQQTLTVHIKWLREKIEKNPKNPEKILTVWGVGYKYI